MTNVIGSPSTTTIKGSKLYETARGFGIGGDRNSACFINRQTLDFLQFSEPCEIVSVKFDEVSPMKKTAPVVDSIPLAVPVHSSNAVGSFKSWSAELVSEWVTTKTDAIIGKQFLANGITGKVLLELSAGDLSAVLKDVKLD